MKVTSYTPFRQDGKGTLVSKKSKIYSYGRVNFVTDEGIELHGAVLKMTANPDENGKAKNAPFLDLPKSKRTIDGKTVYIPVWHNTKGNGLNQQLVALAVAAAQAHKQNAVAPELAQANQVVEPDEVVEGAEAF